ncbi:chorismate-binding protein [Cutibacterium equinum]|uniref:Chorismate-binding protein n=1 Tax=Cutibacterium equinum TaxID=3016342 RepID=A0ABY7R1K0_9ACTN|nr:chorismate-binding protein [Cutibacterium equinum]WCC81159.1 chorismate-binding protein [Cutibacterium equinum]
MTPHDSVCFLHRDYGMVGLGEITRFETDSPTAADVWWEALCDDLEHETEMPGAEATGPVAFGSFTFDPDRSSSRSVMIVPQTIIGRWPGYSWLTQLSWGSVDEDPPRPQPAPPSPTAVTMHDGVVTAQQWRLIAQQVQDIMGPDDLEQIVLMRDLEAKAASPVDPRWIVETLHSRFPHAYTYLVEGSVGVTSKLTVGVSKSLVSSRVLTHSPATDENHEVLLAALQNEGPLAAHHAEIVERTCESLAQFCDTLHIPDCPGAVFTERSNYLVSDVTGIHSPDQGSCLTLVDALCPPAFVTGLPPHRAQFVLAEVEHVDRGRVSGPTGWVDSLGNGQWVTDCRGGQIDGTDPSVVHIFSGHPIGHDDDTEILSRATEHSIDLLREIFTTTSQSHS